jgi:predicted nucleic acid-binding protein
VKLVLREPEEAALRVEMSTWDGFVSSALLAVEAVRACSRHRGEYAQDAREWLLDIALVPLADALLDDAISLQPPGLRSLDAIHLATALSIRDDLGVFFTYDERLGVAADGCGLNVVAPS